MIAQEQFLSIGQQSRQLIERYSYCIGRNKNDDLQGLCAIGAAIVFRKLEQNGFVPRFVISEGGGGAHCFVECSSYIIDVTATQFGKGPIEILKWSEADPTIWHASHYADSLDEFQNHLEDWHHSEYPTNWLLDWLDGSFD